MRFAEHLVEFLNGADQNAAGACNGIMQFAALRNYIQDVFAYPFGVTIAYISYLSEAGRIDMQRMYIDQGFSRLSSRSVIKLPGRLW